MKNVLVSVIIPTYNRAYCIEKAIQSVLNQSYRNIELIIVDDCSLDNTEKIVKKISDDRIVYVKNEQNLGAAGSRNKGAQIAKGELLAFNDSDDVWYEDKLQLQLRQLELENAQMVYCRFRRCNRNGDTVAVIPNEVDQADTLTGNVYSLMLERNVISTQTVVIQKELFNQLGGFNQEMKALEDYELFLRATKLTPVSFVDDVLVEAVDFGDGINDARKNSLANVKAIVLMAEEFKEDIRGYELSACFKSNLPFFVKNLEKDDFEKLEKKELIFVASEMEKYTETLHEQIGLLEETIRKLNEWHGEKDKTIQQLNEWHWEKDKTIQQLNEWNWEKDRYIKELEERIKEYEK